MKKEIELKYHIPCLADFKLLLSKLKKQTPGPINKFTQKNIFFDTPQLDLRRLHIILRLRRENKNYYLCVKQSKKHKIANNVSIRLEFEALINAQSAALMIKHQLSPLEVLATLPAKNPDEHKTRDYLCSKIYKITENNLHIIGSFTNKRIKIPLILKSHKFYLELDHTTYPDKSEIFEMELELNNQHKARLIQPLIENMLQELKLQTQASMPKSDRLYKILFG
jgi:uncharacterized protein YjbK